MISLGFGAGHASGWVLMAGLTISMMSFPEDLDVVRRNHKPDVIKGDLDCIRDECGCCVAQGWSLPRHEQPGAELCGCRSLPMAAPRSLQRRAAGGQHSAHGVRNAEGFLRARGVRRPHGLRPRARSRADRAESHRAGGDAGQGLPRRPHARGPSPRPRRPRGQQALPLAARPRRHRRRGAARPHPCARRVRVGDHRGAAPERKGERRRQARQGRLLRHGPGAHPQAEARRESRPHGHHHRRVRAHHHARGQRPRLRVSAAGRLLRRHRLWQPCSGCEDGDHAGRRLRRRVEFRRSCKPAAVISTQQPAAAMIKLHGIWHSGATSRVLTVLLEKEVEFILVPVNSYAGESKKGEHLALHPFGQVPVLQDGDFTLFESRAIIRYICERFRSQGTPSLYGFTSADKARVEQWLEVESQVLQPVLRPLVKQFLGPRMWNTQNDDAVPDEKIVAEHTLKLAKILDVYEVQLSKHKYLAGDFVSIADLSHLPMTYYYFCLAKQPHLLTARTHVAAWFQAISTRPSWCSVLDHAALFFNKWAST